MKTINTKQNLIETYKAYAFFIRQGNFEAAKHAAKAYNRILKALGGIKNNPGEGYLTMGGR